MPLSVLLGISNRFVLLYPITHCLGEIPPGLFFCILITRLTPLRCCCAIAADIGIQFLVNLPKSTSSLNSEPRQARELVGIDDATCRAHCCKVDRQRTRAQPTHSQRRAQQNLFSRKNAVEESIRHAFRRRLTMIVATIPHAMQHSQTVALGSEVYRTVGRSVEMRKAAVELRHHLKASHVHFI